MPTYLERRNILLAGKMNAGKSTIFNLLTQAENSIVDATPGTTADTKIAVMEIHGLGPVKLFDSAGIDEAGELGEKKRRKVYANLKISDLLLLVISSESTDFTWENMLLEQAALWGKKVAICLNCFNGAAGKFPDALKKWANTPHLAIDGTKEADRAKLLDFIKENCERELEFLPLLPFVTAGEYYVLVIPMDDETPEGRLLRPQALALEFITRRFAWPICYRLDLKKARSAEAPVKAAEKARWHEFIATLAPKLGAVITDSQAIDVVAAWTPEEIELTTFSVMMIEQQSKGRLSRFVAGQDQVNTLKAGDKVLIYEACNHSRIAEDIGTVQIPALLQNLAPGVKIDHAFGKQLNEIENLEQYKLVIHCGGCMLSPQVLAARLKDLDAKGVFYTNYGLFLAARQGPAVLKRVVKPFVNFYE